jgi:hypothetical protein
MHHEAEDARVGATGRAPSKQEEQLTLSELLTIVYE